MGGKVIALWLSLAMILTLIVIVDITMDFAHKVEGTTLYVNATGGGGAYTKIQDAINASKDGDTVFIYSGIYHENVFVDKSINLTGEERYNTIIEGGKTPDVIYLSANWVNISGFTVKNGNECGIYLTNSSNCLFYDNIICNNGNTGVLLNRSENCYIMNSLIYNNTCDGVLLEYSNYNTISNISAYENDDCGIFLYSPSSYNVINNNEVYNNTYGGIFIEHSQNNFLLNNTIHHNWDDGINLLSCSNHTIRGNDVYNNSAGISLFSSNENIISNNILLLNTYEGICLWDSSNNNIVGENNVSSSEFGIENGYSSYNWIFNNEIFNNYFGFEIDSSADIIAENNTIYGNQGYGIELVNSTNCSVIGNHIFSNHNDGIDLWYNSTRNRIYSNCIEGNIEGGIELEFSPNNLIYNNYFNNINNAWDNGNNVWNVTITPGTNIVGGPYIGGNFWSDYRGVDKFKGPGQNISGSDGIGDTNYSIDLDSVDNYPLMKPFQNYTILKQGWNLISLPLIQLEQNRTKVLAYIDGLYDAVQWYDIADPKDPWKHYRVGKPYGNNLLKINETKGVWIHVTQPGDTIFHYNGTPPTSNQTILLHPGWNMVGYPSLTYYNRTEGLNNLIFGTDVDSVWTYNAATQKWKELSPSDYFEIGRGYWVHAKKKCEWEVPL